MTVRLIELETSLLLRSTTHFKATLLQHDPSKPIGTWSGVHADGGKLKGTLNLAPTRLGEHVRENIAAGVLKAASVGFVPVEFSPIKGGGFRFDKIELMETSVVSIPASRGSLRERSQEERKADRLEDVAEFQAKAAQWKREDVAYAAKNAAEARKRQDRIAFAEKLKAEARAKAEWNEYCRRTTPEERREDRLRDLERMIGGDEGARAAQRIRDLRR